MKINNFLAGTSCAIKKIQFMFRDTYIEHIFEMKVLNLLNQLYREVCKLKCNGKL